MQYSRCSLPRAEYRGIRTSLNLLATLLNAPTEVPCSGAELTRSDSVLLCVHLIIQKILTVYAARSAKGKACKKHSRLGNLKNKLDKALERSYAVKFYAETSQMT